MYAIVRQLAIKETFKAENARRVQNEFLPKARAIPGFIDCYLIYDTKETEISIGLFRDKKGCDEFNRVASEFVKSNESNVTLTSVTEGEVVVQSRTATFA